MNTLILDHRAVDSLGISFQARGRQLISLRLRRLMCGKAPPFRDKTFIDSEAAPRVGGLAS
jgi:hypothetical protein